MTHAQQPTHVQEQAVQQEQQLPQLVQHEVQQEQHVVQQQPPPVPPGVPGVAGLHLGNQLLSFLVTEPNGELHGMICPHLRA